MRYKNISNGVVPVSGIGQVGINGFIELSAEEINIPEIKPYIGKYLVPADVAPVLATPPPPPSQVKMPSKVSLTRVEGQMLVNPPPDKTEEELAADEQAEDDEEMVPVTKAKRTEDGSGVQSIDEVSKGKVRYAVEKLKAMTSPKKKEEYIDTIDDPILLEAILPKFKGKAGEFIQQRLKKLS